MEFPGIVGNESVKESLSLAVAERRSLMPSFWKGSRAAAAMPWLSSWPWRRCVLPSRKRVPAGNVPIA